MSSKLNIALESGVHFKQSFETPSSDEIHHGAVEKAPTTSRLRFWIKKLAVETGGIERVTDEQRADNPSKVWNACTFW